MNESDTPYPPTVGPPPTVRVEATNGARLGLNGHDVRGWDVLTADKTLVGVVDDLLVFATSQEPAALAVLAHGDLIIVSAAATELEPAARRVLTELSYAQFAALARHAVRRAADAGSADVAGRTEVTVERTADGEEIIRVPVVEEELVVLRRPVVREVVVIRKRAVVEERVIEAELRRERVEVEPIPGPPPRAAAD